MFGYVNASIKELTKEQQKRYNEVYCGICRQIRLRSGKLCRFGLSYDMVFLALVLMSLYEPEETRGDRACGLHPCRPKGWVDNAYIAYAADMNVALAYYNAADDWQDDKNLAAKAMCGIFGGNYDNIRTAYPRQCQAIEECIQTLSRLEKENCPSADETANCFGALMAELMVYREDLWAPTLRSMGMALGRFIYLADAARDYTKDRRKGKYNPYLAMGMEENWKTWEEYLVLAMGRCTHKYEKLPLVQDKALLDNILYSGVWMRFHRKETKQQEDGK